MKQKLSDLKNGFKCPACGRFSKAYKRPITSSMCVALILLYKKYKKDLPIHKRATWVHIEDFLKNSYCPSSIRADAVKLQHWGLIKAKVAKREDGSSRNGYYMITAKGRKFVENKVKVPGSILFFHGKVLKVYNQEMVNIHDALNNKFNYGKLMGV